MLYIFNYPFLDSNIPTKPAYGVYLSQLVRIVINMPISKIDTLCSLVGCSNKDIGMIIYVPVLRLRDTIAHRACECELPVEQSQYSEIQRRIRHVAKCLYMRARANHHSHLQRACECWRSQVARQRPF